MPGIAGIISGKRVSKFQMERDTMMSLMVHEPFHEAGYYENEKLGIWCGCVSHRGSHSDGSLFWNERKDQCLLFVGEIFPQAGSFGSNNHPRLNSRAEIARYLLQLFDEKGLDALKWLNGWFSGLLVDLRSNKIALFNDRYGLGRIYFHHNEEGFYFCSQAKGLLNVLQATRQLDPKGLAEFTSCGCVLQNRTLFKGVNLLPPAARWCFAPGKEPLKEVYFEKETWENQSELSEASYYSKLRETFALVLPKYFQGAGQIGMSLTGGLDGRMIMAWSDASPGDLPCYTFGGPYRESADVKIARQIARVCHQPHRVIQVGMEFLREFPTLAQKTVYISDGAMDVSGAVELYANRLAREIGCIRLTGNYGSEILRGSIAFKPALLATGAFDPGFAALVNEASRTYAWEAQGNKRSFIAFKQVPWYHFSRFAVERSQLTPRSPYLDNDLVALSFQIPAALSASAIPAWRLIADRNPKLSEIPTDRGLVACHRNLLAVPRRWCQKLTFKAEYAYDSGMPQWLAGLDNALSGLHLDRVFMGRHKFQHFRVWYRDYLASYLQDILLDRRTLQRSYLDSRFVKQMVQNHLRGIRNFTLEIHKILTAELIQRALVEKN
jgi:asparagine synthase (glutamine-hydrolysing)